MIKANGWWLMAVITFVMAFSAVAHAAGPEFSPAPISTQSKAAIQRELDYKLLDGSSARYKWPPQKDAKIYCGMVNAKNAYGAYTGWEPFAALLDGTDVQRVTLLESDEGVLVPFYVEECLAQARR